MVYKAICGVYRILCLPTGEKYVGTARNIGARWQVHRSQLNRGIHHSKLLQQRWMEHPPEAFEFSVLDLVSPDELLSLERRYVVSGEFAFNAIVPRRNPMQGRKHSPEALAKMSANRKGKGGRKGRVFSAEHRAALSVARRGKPNPSAGKNLTSEKAKEMNVLSRLVVRKPMSEDARKRMSEAQKRRDNSRTPRGPTHPLYGKPAWNRGKPGPKGELSARSRPVSVDGVRYPSLSAGAAALGITYSSLWARMKRNPERFYYLLP